MAIAKMLSMKLVGMQSEKESLLSALHRTGSVEIVKTPEIFSGRRIVADKAEIREKKEACERAAELVRRAALEYKRDKVEQDGFAVDYDEFIRTGERESEVYGKVSEILALEAEIARLSADAVANRSAAAEYLPYLNVREMFSSFKNTEKTICRLGAADERNYDKLLSLIPDGGLLTVVDEGVSDGKHALCAIYHNEFAADAEKILGECGFADCPFKEAITAKEAVEKLNASATAADKSVEELKKKIADAGECVKDVKTLSDYYEFLLQKGECSDGFLCTDSTFVLEAFVPEERKADVTAAIDGVSGYSYYEFELVPEGEYAPTLMRNKKVTRQFEFVTNLYSVPKYGSFDPNAVLGFFFSMFMGFITADAVYGLLMAVGGFAFAKSQKRETTMTRLAMVMCYSGLFTILFGVLFNSFLGFPLFDKPILPDPIKDSSNLAGISIPTILLLALGMGVVHIMVGLFLSALINFQHGKILDGIFDGIMWDLFLGGALVAVTSLIGVLPESVMMPSLIVCLGGLAVGVLASGRHEKGFGKITKPFSSLYGLINYMSDILSYARLYGLMLSGAQIASIVSVQLAKPMLSSPGGVVGVIACVLILLLGHAFNIAMGLLGAFVHDARLQYVEFFSRFYEGDGELFTPFGMKFEHLYLK